MSRPESIQEVVGGCTLVWFMATRGVCPMVTAEAYPAAWDAFSDVLHEAHGLVYDPHEGWRKPR